VYKTQDWCLRKKFDDGIIVSEGKVVSWLQDEVLLRTLPPKGPPRGRRRPTGRPLQLELAVEGSQQPTGLSVVMASPDSSEDEDEDEDEGKGEGVAPKTLKVQTVRVYLAAIAELYAAQVSMGINKNTNFRGAALKKLMNGLARQQAQRRQDTFEDRGSSSINDGYSTEQFLLMQEQLLAGAAKNALVSYFIYMSALFHI
jgi:hypothetical protein